MRKQTYIITLFINLILFGLFCASVSASTEYNNISIQEYNKAEKEYKQRTEKYQKDLNRYKEKIVYDESFAGSKEQQEESSRLSEVYKQQKAEYDSLLQMLDSVKVEYDNFKQIYNPQKGNLIFQIIFTGIIIIMFIIPIATLLSGIVLTHFFNKPLGKKLSKLGTILVTISALLILISLKMYIPALICLLVVSILFFFYKKIDKSNNNKPYPDISQSILLHLSVYVVLIAVFIPIIIIYKDSKPNYFLLTLVSVISFLIWYLFISKRYKNPLKNYFSFENINYEIIIYSLAVMAGIYIFKAGLSSVIRMPDWFISKILSETMKRKGGIYFILIEIVILAPIFEEIVYRGFILRGLIGNYGQKKALLSSALLFSFIHMNPSQLLPAFMLGLFFAWLYIRLNNVVLGIIIHSIYNGLAIIPSIIYYKNINTDISIYRLNDGHSIFFHKEIIIMLLGAGIIYLGIKYLIRKFSEKYGDNLLVPDEKYEEIRNSLFEENLIKVEDKYNNTIKQS
ncbi:MAG: type II CAAX endopeptidase family protein [bacterium]|nr:type II CAAX endopeptidase family protein [bacterium]